VKIPLAIHDRTKTGIRIDANTIHFIRPPSFSLIEDGSKSNEGKGTLAML
jgi:hypothetical protein